jgi:hypothetical protein
MEATVARVETATLAQNIKDHPELSERFMAFLRLRNSQVEVDLVDHLFFEHGCPGWPGSGTAYRRPGSDGRTRRANAFTNKFPRLGLVEYNGHLKLNVIRRVVARSRTLVRALPQDGQNTDLR